MTCMEILFDLKDYFIPETRKRETMSKTLTKYIVTFDYFDQIFINFISNKFYECVSIASLTVFGKLVGRVSAILCLVFSISKSIVIRKKEKA